jgi:hypothetical protein
MQSPSSELMKALLVEFSKMFGLRSISDGAGTLNVEVYDDGRVEDFEGWPEWIEGFPVRYSWAREVQVQCGCVPRRTKMIGES